jgi:hypothetical protein|tara:strand:- start:1997 stop:2212 length:216 start_codon:yes stop_codon:yes gene_type:complete
MKIFPTNLDELLTAMCDDVWVPALTDREMSGLPTFGGTEPSDTAEVWSWDKDRLIVGTHPGDYEIANRKDW